MHIMTEQGWKPLFDPRPKQAQLRKAVEVAEEALKKAQSVVATTEEQRKHRHYNIMAAYRDVFTAHERTLGARV